MGSKEDAIISEPNRFAGYLSDEDVEYIAQGTTQPDRIHRLKERFEKVFPTDDPKGEHFLYGGESEKDYDLRASSDYAKALEALYEASNFQIKLKEKAYAIMKGRIKVVDEKKKMAKIEKRAMTVEKLPKKLVVTVTGYTNKKGKRIGGYNRAAPDLWTKPQEDWVQKHYRKWDVKEFQLRFNNKWKTKRLKGGITSKFYRLVK